MGEYLEDEKWDQAVPNIQKIQYRIHLSILWYSRADIQIMRPHQMVYVMGPCIVCSA